MTVPSLPTRVADQAVHRQRIAETVNDILAYRSDAWRRQTPDEQALGIPVIDGAYPPGHRSRYNTFSDAVAISGAHPLFIYEDETISASVSLPDNACIYGINRPLITCTANGVHVLDGTSLASVTIQGVRFKGSSSTTAPSTGFGGFAAANNGLVTLTACTDVRVQDCEFDTFYNGVTAQDCDRVWILRNRVRNFRIQGILFSSSSLAHIDDNVITDCTQTGGAVAYGIHGTGDEDGGKPQNQVSICRNKIDGVPSWDGIMSHDGDGLVIAENDIRDVRQGIDIGHLTSTNVMRNIRIANNYIESTATNTWGSSAAQHGGIFVAGYDATSRVLGAVIIGNVIRNFFTTSGMVGGGDPNHIGVSNADDCTIMGNVVVGGGAIINNAGIGVGGTCNRLSIHGNTLQGDMGRGGIRLATVTSDGCSINGNTIKQTTSSVEGVLISGSTITALSVSSNPTNSTSPYATSTSTLTPSGDYYEAGTTYDPPSLADGAGTTTTVTVTGAAVGDFAVASFGGDTQGLTITAWVSAADTVSVRLQNESGGTLDIGSATLRARAYKKVT